MEAAKNSVLTYRRTLVSPRSPVSSDLWNDNASEIGADLRTLATQVNRILWAINAGANKEVIWSNSNSLVEGEHGIDAKALWWDSSATNKTSIFDHVNTLSAQITAINDVTIPGLEAVNIKYDNANVNWFVDSTNQNVKHALDKIIAELPTITGPDGLPGVLLSNVTIDESLTQEGSGDGYTVGTNDIPWAGGYFNNLNVTGSLVVGGSVIDPSGLTTTAAGVTYTPGAGTPNYDGETITNVQEALDVVGGFEIEQVFENADQPIKRIPTQEDVNNGVVFGTAGMSIKQWLNEVFFPTLQASVSFNSIPLQELGTTFTGPVSGVVTAEDESTFTSLVLTDLGATNISLPNNAGNWSTAVTATANTTYTITLDAGDPSYTKTATTALQFVPPVYYAAGAAGLTEAEIKAQNQSDLRTSQAGSHTFSVTDGYFYILIPDHGSFSQITSILDPNGFQNITAVDYLNALGPGGVLQNTPTTVSITMADGVTQVDYWAYRWIDQTTQSNFTLTFS